MNLKATALNVVSSPLALLVYLGGLANGLLARATSPISSNLANTFRTASERNKQTARNLVSR